MKKILMFILMATMLLCGCSSNSKKAENNANHNENELLDVDYTTNDNGTYTYNDNIYKYKIEVSGIEGESQVTFIVLTNDTETSFEDVAYSLKKAEMSTGIPEFVILGWY